jgi:predicted metalloprotease with PDZ domain
MLVHKLAAAGALITALAPALGAQQRSALSLLTPAVQSAPISNVRYGVTFDSTTARNRMLHVTMTFEVVNSSPVLLSLPVWTPGAYEVSDFAKNVVGFTPAAGSTALRWDKLDYDTWRVRPTGPGSVSVAFDFIADTLDNAMSWSKPDFALFNGTNVFLYPEGRSLDFPATVTITTEPDWKVVTSMHPAGAARTYRENSYHDLVDMPFFIGRVDLDSTQINGKWTRFATYPMGAYQGAGRDSLERRIARVIPAEANVLGETPWDTYSIMIIYDSTFQGGSALEHQASHVGVYTPALGMPGLDTVLTSITAHEIFHAWNVKRLRPADMVPYRYSAAQPTPWLWVSEGITDYYASVALARAGVYDSAAFARQMMSNMDAVANAPPTALEDASLSTWIHPKDGSGYIYYPKGALAGFMLDIMIRDASDNQRSLDGVMRSLYTTTYKRGRGFTGDEWWSAVRQAAGGKGFDDFIARYVDGRDPYPMASMLRQAGMLLVTDSTKVARVGVSTQRDSTGERVMQTTPGGAAAQAGVQAGDYLVSVAGVTTTEPDWAARFRSQYNTREGADMPIVVRRGGRDITLNSRVMLVPVVSQRIDFDPAATPRAVRIRNGIMRGS